MNLPELTFENAVEYCKSERNDIPELFQADSSIKSKKITLDIHTWVGRSFGAIHYYGKLDIPGYHLYDMKIKRPLTQQEITSDPQRWEAWEEGDLTDCFETIEDIISYGKQIFKLRFKGDWEFEIDYPWGRKEKIVIN